MNKFSNFDKRFMKHAIDLAKRGLYSTTPNPRVGCVIAKNNKIIASGYHEASGGDHAEVNAIKNCKDSLEGSTLYTNLQPCDHFGKTPPCILKIIETGIKKVIFANLDPSCNFLKSKSLLKEKKIELLHGLLDKEASKINEGFFFRLKNKRPLLRIKIAAGIDGKTSLENGESRWITGKISRINVHHLRAQSCAILTGIGTLLSDDPMLNVRHVKTKRQPVKILLDSNLRIPLNSKILKLDRTIIFYAKENKVKKRELEKRGAEVIYMPNEYNKVDLKNVFFELGNRKFNEIFVETGINLQSALMRENLIDELIIFYAPKIMGSRGRGMLDLGNITDMNLIKEVRINEIKRFGKDLRVRANFIK